MKTWENWSKDKAINIYVQRVCVAKSAKIYWDVLFSF